MHFTPMKPGSFTLSFYGIDTVVLYPMTGNVINSTEAKGVMAICRLFPGMAWTFLLHGRFCTTQRRQLQLYHWPC